MAGIFALHGKVAANTDAVASNAFGIEDYFDVRQVAELAISKDGSAVLYVVEQPTLKNNATTRTTYLQPAKGGSQAEIVQVADDARDLAWIPESQEIAYLSGRMGRTQVFAYDIKSRKSRQLTDSMDTVIGFRVAPNGGALAYATYKQSESLYSRIRRDGPGVLIDTDLVGYMDLIDPNQPSLQSWGTSQLWIRSLRDSTAQTLNVPGDAQTYFWSPDSKSLSVTYVATDDAKFKSKSLWRIMCTSVGVLDVATNQFRVVAEAVVKNGTSIGEIYSGGEWIPGQDSLLIRRSADASPWRSAWAFPDVAVLPRTARAGQDRHLMWQPIHWYPNRSVSRVIPVSSKEIMIQTRIRAVDGLFELTSAGLRRAKMLTGIADSNTMFDFSNDFKTAAFVNEGMSSPPEIYVWREGVGFSRLTNLNTTVRSRILPDVREVQWTSADGLSISGWLLTPDAKLFPQPWPLLTYVHGGPSYAFPDRFAPASANWPYPFEVFALQGIAVFIPHYRGTLSFGKKVAEFREIDEEPISDIVTGIHSLVDRTIADRRRLGISGHSHGGWLGPLIATRTKMFRAGSFAEGWSNQLVLHELHAGATNRDIHMDGVGLPGLYEAPERYLELSPDMHFKGLRMASLFESGSQAIALTMLGMPKAARYFGIPCEFYIYPQTAHALKIPVLQKESAQRNLDWFSFWLLDKEDPAPEKREQFERWRRLRGMIE